jgi:cellulose synthase operon protein YhjQ
MPTLALLSPCGGTGRSTLTAALASVSARRKTWSLAVEFDPQNALALHFGADTAPTDGLASRAARQLAWNTAALSAADGTLVLPFGALDSPALVDWERRLIVEPDWLHARLESIASPADGWIYIDTPRWPSTLARQGLAASDVALVVLRADPQSVQLLSDMRHLSEDRSALFVVNQYDPTRRLQSDCLSILREKLGDALCPVPVQRDEAVPEAFARRLGIEDHAAHAQAVHDVHGLLAWIRRQYRTMKESQPSNNVR